MKPILVVGSVAFDTLHNHLGSHKQVLGGSATYASLAASLFTPVQLVGVVGKDYPEDALSLYRSRNIDLAGLEVRDGKTFHWEGRYSDDLSSRTSLRTDLNVFENYHPVIPEAYRDTPYVMLGNISPDLQLEVLDQIRAPKLVVADTMNFWIDGQREDLNKVLARVDLFVINEEEAQQLTGKTNILLMARALMAMGPRIVVIKRGEYGAMLFSGDEIFSAPAFPLEEVQDPTGAGDSFAGGMLGCIAQSDNLEPGTLRRAVVYGSALASHCVSNIAVHGLIALTRRQVDERFRAFKQLAHFATEAEAANAPVHEGATA